MPPQVPRQSMYPKNSIFHQRNYQSNKDDIKTATDCCLLSDSYLYLDKNLQPQNIDSQLFNGWFKFLYRKVIISPQFV